MLTKTEQKNGNCYALCFELPDKNCDPTVWAYDSGREISNALWDFCKQNGKVKPWVMAMLIHAAFKTHVDDAFSGGWFNDQNKVQ